MTSVCNHDDPEPPQVNTDCRATLNRPHFHQAVSQVSILIRSLWQRCHLLLHLREQSPEMLSTGRRLVIMWFVDQLKQLQSHLQSFDS
eukprot:12495274-Prorocentrum_lima.AAC.1